MPRACPTAARSPRCATRRSSASPIYQHFPNYYEYFQTKSFSYGKRTYGNHNRLLGYKGASTASRPATSTPPAST